MSLRLCLFTINYHFHYCVTTITIVFVYHQLSSMSLMIDFQSLLVFIMATATVEYEWAQATLKRPVHPEIGIFAFGKALQVG